MAEEGSEHKITRGTFLRGAVGLIGRFSLRGLPNPKVPEHISPLGLKKEESSVQSPIKEHVTSKTPDVKTEIVFPELNTSQFHLPKPEMESGKSTATGLYERIMQNDRVRDHIDTLLIAQSDVF